jgi:hypothetical protein
MYHAWEEKMKVYTVLVAKPEGMRSLGIPGHRWEDNVTNCITEIGWGHVERIHLS